MIKPMVVAFVLLQFDATLRDGCRISELAQFLQNELDTGFFQEFMNGYGVYEWEPKTLRPSYRRTEVAQ